MLRIDAVKERIMRTNYIYAALITFAIAVYVTGLFPETTVDSAKYASISREILDHGDFIHLKIHGEPYLQKPPLLFWLGAISFRIFGISMFAFKLPTLLFTFLGIYSTYRLGLLCYDRRTGLIAAIVYSASEALLLFNMDLHTDALLTSNIIFGTWQLAEYLNSRKAVNFILGFTGVGLAMISKGMIGLAVPVFAIGGFLIAKKDLRTLFSAKWLAGLPILVLILLPTLKGLFDQFGISGIKFFFWSNNIERIRGDYSNNRHDYTFFFHTIAYIFLPWSFYAFTAFIRDWRQWRGSRFSFKNSSSVYNYSVIIPLALIISVSSQQSPHYLLPMIPFLSIITARLINDVSLDDKYPKTFKWMLVIRDVITVIMWVLTVTFMAYFFPTRKLLIWVPVLVMLLLLIYSYLKLRTRVQKLTIPLIITILTFNFIANTVYMPSAIKYHGTIQASYLFNKIGQDNSVLYTYDYPHYETYFYPKRVSIRIYEEQLGNILDHESCWFITSERGYNEIKTYGEEIITSQNIFPYKKLTNISIRFLNPRTRKSELKNIYLLKIR